MTGLDAILAHVPTALLVIFRIGGLMILAPVLSSVVIPVRVKVFLTFLIGLAIYPTLSAELIATSDAEWDVWALAPLVATEAMIGLIIGFAATLPLMGVQAGGLLMGYQMGLGFAQFYNPAIDDESDVLGQFLYFMAIAGFLMIGGHEAMLLAVLHSFSHVPLGGFTPDATLAALLSGLFLAAFELALRVAAPLTALILLQSVAMGFISKTVPQLNILSLGFPLRILAGLLIIALGLVILDEIIMESIDEALTAIFGWIEMQASLP